jgi:gliding motility-associated-like protein
MKNRASLLIPILSLLAFSGFGTILWHQFIEISTIATVPTPSNARLHPQKIKNQTHLSMGHLLSDLVPYDTLYAATPNCAAETNVCLPGLPLDNVLKYQFNVNNTLYNGRFTGCDFDTIRQYVYQNLTARGYAGPYTLKSWMLNGKKYSGVIPNINALLDSMNRWDAKGAWKAITTGSAYEGGVAQNVYGDMQFEYKDVGGELIVVNLKPKYILQPKGTLMKLPTGFHKIHITETSTNMKDSFYVRVACITTERITRTIPLDGLDTLCLNFSELTTSKLASISNIYANRANNATTFKLIKNNTCVAMKAVQVGTDTAAYVACDKHGLCDTTIIITQVELKSRAKTVNITVKEGAEYVYCPDSADIGNKITSFKSNCLTNEAFSVNLKGRCAIIKGLVITTINIGCAVIVCNGTKCDTINLNIKVTPETTTNSSRTLNYTFSEGDELNWCLTDTLANNPIKSFTNACARESSAFTTTIVNAAKRCVNVKGTKIGVGDKACMVACDGKGKCDTTYLLFKVEKKVVVVPPKAKTETFNITEGETLNWCLDTTKYAAAALPLKSFTNHCAASAGTLATATLAVAKRCVAIKGIKAGNTEKACIISCTKTGVCDTTILNIVVAKRTTPVGSKIKIVNLTIPKNKKNTYNIDTTALQGGKINSVRVEACKRKFGEFASFLLSSNERSIVYDGRDIGSDTACVFVKNDKGITDTTYLYVKVIEQILIKSTIKRDTVLIGQTKQYCIDTTKYGGVIDHSTLKNICPKSSGKHVVFTPNNIKLCFNFKGIAVGTDTACVVLCSKAATCDTTLLIIYAKTNPNPPPIAAKDSVQIKQDSAVTIKVASNDLIFGKPYTLKITKIPTRGKAVISGGNIEYVPDRGFCGAKDKLTYEVCTTNGCDTASVIINVKCNSVSLSGALEVMQGLSPNGDGNNDVLVIKGLEKFPNHKIAIFNRWGAMVYEKTNYQNDWGGTWNNNYLPDGTYFYILDDGGGKIMDKGYLQIRR